MARRSAQPNASAQQTLHLQRTTCIECASLLHIAHRTSRTIRRLDGVWRPTMPLMRCLNPKCLRFHRLCRPEEEGVWALPHGELGFDVIALVGQLCATGN